VQTILSLPNTHPHPACLTDELLIKQCSFTAGISGGPGGQHRNKVTTHIRVVHNPSGITAQAGERRSQQENKLVALTRLRLQLAIHLRSEPPSTSANLAAPDFESFLAKLDASIGILGSPACNASELWQTRVRSTRQSKTGKIACNPNHHDYPALLAEALDVIAAHNWEPKAAATPLGVTPSQLLKLIKDHPPALEELNRQRIHRSKHPMK
jgi:hypothetical protein